MHNDVIYLVSEHESVDDYGDLQTIEERRAVFAELKSIGQSEFYQAEAIGLKPEIKFLIADYLDYRNEKKIIYKGYAEDEESAYSVIRTYRTGNALEIVCSKGVGT